MTRMPFVLAAVALTLGACTYVERDRPPQQATVVVPQQPPAAVVQQPAPTVTVRPGL
ncbi:hypothetical protein [Falsiroseomonas oryziterrae]|uniref:hypothetical protein n=1 Tax=Falsiroseomonas oryziterrae TaxID=2911368 RepID=UPI001F2930EA|nr:hypothetical protein [Roseomonas sp. NPKOSM-4]